MCVFIVFSLCVLNFILPTCTSNFAAQIKSLSRSCLHYFDYNLSSDITMEPALFSRTFLRLFQTTRWHISETLTYASLHIIVMDGSTILNVFMCISHLQYRTSTHVYCIKLRTFAFVNFLICSVLHRFNILSCCLLLHSKVTVFFTVELEVNNFVKRLK
jgi:hypothetical protein